MATQTARPKPPIRFVFNERKAAQAAAHILILGGGGPMDRVRLVKLLYLADRRMLIQRGRTITGDAMVSMKRGPVLSGVYDLIKGNPMVSARYWSATIATRGKSDVLLATTDVQTDELSESEISVIDSVYSDFRHLSTWRLRDYSHGLPEYTKTERKSIPIQMEKILADEAKASPEDIERIRGDSEELRFFASLSR